MYFACPSNSGALFTFSFIHLSINHVSTAPLCCVAELCHLLHLSDPMSLFTLPDVIWIIAIFHSLPEILMLTFFHSAVVICCHSYFLCHSQHKAAALVSVSTVFQCFHNQFCSVFSVSHTHKEMLWNEAWHMSPQKANYHNFDVLLVFFYSLNKRWQMTKQFNNRENIS